MREKSSILYRFCHPVDMNENWPHRKPPWKYHAFHLFFYLLNYRWADLIFRKPDFAKIKRIKSCLDKKIYLAAKPCLCLRLKVGIVIFDIVQIKAKETIE